MSQIPKINGKLDMLPSSNALAGNRNTFEEGGRVLVKGFASKRTAQIAASFLKVLNENKINSQRLLRVEDKKIYLEYLPGQQLKNLRGRGIQRRLAHLQAQIHSLDWSGSLVNIDSQNEFISYFDIYIKRIVKEDLIGANEAIKLQKSFEALIPEKMFDAPIHSDYWVGNILVYNKELYLIDFGTVKKLSLEYDLLDANRTFTRRVEAWIKGRYALNSKYIEHYATYGDKSKAVMKSLKENYSFYFSFLMARKTVASLNTNMYKIAKDFFYKLNRTLSI